MYLSKPSLPEIVKKQYLFKCKAYLGTFISLLAVQILALLFSGNGVGMSGTGSNDISIDINYYSADIVLVFTFIWAFITAILLTTKANRYPDFTFVANRLSSQLANLLFLITASIIGGVSAMLSGYLLKISIYLLQDVGLVGTNLLIPWPEFLLGVIVTSLYILLLFAVGYFIGMVVQLHPFLTFLVPVGVIGFFFVGARSGGSLLEAMIQFFINETSVAIFVSKVLISAGVLFIGSILLANRLEVSV